MRLDAHQHYWRINRGDYGWITPDVTTLYRDYLPEDLLPHLNRHKIDQTILVQAAPTIEESQFLLELSDKYDSIAGVVGWIDLDQPNYLVQFNELAKHPKFLGFRLNIQDMTDETTALKDHYIEALRYFAKEDVPVDLLFVHHQFPTVLKLLEQVPNLRGVVDHLGKPDIASQKFEPWNEHIKEIASYENIYCKLSGMVTEANHDHWNKDDFVQYIQHILDTFGINRVMFGSDWPVCLLAGTYDEVVEVLKHGLQHRLSDNDLAKLFGLNAKRFYKLT